MQYSKRQKEVTTSFLRTSSPFHSPLLATAVEAIVSDCANMAPFTSLFATRLSFPVVSTLDGSIMHTIALPELVRLQATQVCDFVRTADRMKAAPYIVELGVGDITALISPLVAGNGTTVLPCHLRVKEAGLSFPRLVARSKKNPNWGDVYAPRLIERNGEVVVDTLFTRLTGRPPIMMAGMTPTTSFYGIDLVAACNSAGFHGELAGGGLPLPEYFVDKVKELVAKQTAGAGVSINMLYLNAYLWGFQFPLVLELAKSGYPIESITIAAGVPTHDKAMEILDGSFWFIRASKSTFNVNNNTQG